MLSLYFILWAILMVSERSTDCNFVGMAQNHRPLLAGTQVSFSYGIADKLNRGKRRVSFPNLNWCHLDASLNPAGQSTYMTVRTTHIGWLKECHRRVEPTALVIQRTSSKRLSRWPNMILAFGRSGHNRRLKVKIKTAPSHEQR